MPRTWASPTRSCRRSPARSTGRPVAWRSRSLPPAGRTRSRSCGRSATDRPSRSRGTTSGCRTAPGDRCAARRSEYVVPTGALTYSTRFRAASAPRVPRFTTSIGSAPARRAHAMKSSVPTRFGSIERQARSCRTGRSRARPDPVLPVVARHEVAARIPDQGDTEPANEAEHVAPPAVGVGGPMTGLVDPAVDRPSHVLDERPEQSPVDGADRRRRIDPGACVSHRRPPRRAHARPRSGPARARHRASGWSGSPSRAGARPWYRDESFAYDPDGGPGSQGRWRIHGLGLPDGVLRAVYADNARRLNFDRTR